jgi:hypothetical protein
VVRSAAQAEAFVGLRLGGIRNRGRMLVSASTKYYSLGLQKSVGFAYWETTLTKYTKIYIDIHDIKSISSDRYLNIVLYKIYFGTHKYYTYFFLDKIRSNVCHENHTLLRTEGVIINSWPHHAIRCTVGWLCTNVASLACGRRRDVRGARPDRSRSAQAFTGWRRGPRACPRRVFRLNQQNGETRNLHAAS